MDNSNFPKPQKNEERDNAFEDIFGDVNTTPVQPTPVVPPQSTPQEVPIQQETPNQTPVFDDFVPSQNTIQPPMQQAQQPYYNQEQDWNNVNSTMPPMSEPKGSGAVAGIAIAGIVLKCIVCALMPIVGIVVSIISSSKGHKSRAKIYRLVSIISLALSIIVGTIVGIYEAKHATDYIDDSYSYIEEYDEEYSDNENVEESKMTTANEETTEEKTKETTTVSNLNASNGNVVNNTAWDDYTVYLSGQKIELPMKYSEFSKLTGYSFEDNEDATTTIKNNQYTTSIPCVNGDKKVNVRIINLGDSQITCSEAWVGGINTYDYQENDAVFAGNLAVGDTFDKNAMISALGQPYDVYDSDDSDFHIYKYENENEFYNGYEIQVSNGKITDISVEKFE